MDFMISFIEALSKQQQDGLSVQLLYVIIRNLWGVQANLFLSVLLVSDSSGSQPGVPFLDCVKVELFGDEPGIALHARRVASTFKRRLACCRGHPHSACSLIRLRPPRNAPGPVTEGSRPTTPCCSTLFCSDCFSLNVRGSWRRGRGSGHSADFASRWYTTLPHCSCFVAGGHTGPFWRLHYFRNGWGPALEGGQCSWKAAVSSHLHGPAPLPLLPHS